MKIGIIVAMEKELRQLQALFKEEEVVVRQCGIGKVNAAIGTAELIREHRPDVIISSGCAGGNGDDINVKDVVVSTELCYHDVYCGRAIDDSTQYGQVQGMPARYKADERLVGIARELTHPQPLPKGGELDMSSTRAGNQTLLPLGGDGGGYHLGLIVTGDWFVDSKEKMRQIVELFPEAKAVDMESAAIAQTCYKYGVPFISYRVVSDIPLRDTDASQYHDFWSQVADTSFATTKKFVEALQQTEWKT